MNAGTGKLITFIAAALALLALGAPMLANHSSPTQPRVAQPAHRILGDMVVGCGSADGLAYLDELRATGDRARYGKWKDQNCSAYPKDTGVTIEDKDDFRRMVHVKKSGDLFGAWVHSYDVY